MDYKCKICAGDLDVDFASGIAVCQYCGVKQTIPTFTSEKSTLLYQQAEHLLKQNEFDKATNLFNQLLITDKSNSDVYWSLLMCKYGVTYVEDPKTKKFMPTCNRTHFGSILNEELFAKAIEFANAEKKTYYTEMANEIDGIQKKILSISKKEKPFDIFISYKETNVDGQRTKDSIVAQELYEDLTNAGYKVFFSRITLEDKIGADYEPYIYAALASSKLMITVSSNSENINSVWVKNEWSRYIGLCQNDKSKSLIPLYFDMDASELPDEFASLPSYDIHSDGFKQELLRGVKKLIPLPVMLAEKRKKRRKILAVSAAVLAVCIAVGFVFSIPYIKKSNEYNKIMAMYRNGQYPQALWEFEKMGNFKDCKKMVEKCESSWRKSVSTAVTDNLISGSSHGHMYVSANGTVETFSYNAGASNENIKIDEHGKVISIADNYDLFALHEDGHLDNFSDFEKYDNIIKVSPLFNATPIALLSDGTLKYGNLYDKYNDPNDVNDEWLTEISTWENIVDFEVFIDRAGSGFCMDEVIVGIHDDGTVSSLIGKSEIKEAERFCEFLESLEKVKSIDISFHYVEDTYQANASVLTTDNKLITYAGGKIQTDSIKGALDIEYIYSDENYDLYVLYENGEVSLLDGKTIMEDVVYMENGFFVTRSGSIYHWETSTPKPANAKTMVFEEWALKNLTQSPQRNKTQNSIVSVNEKETANNNSSEPQFDLSEHYSNSKGISFDYPSNYIIQTDETLKNLNLDPVDVILEADNGNYLTVDWQESNNSLLDMVKNEQTLTDAEGNSVRTIIVPEEIIVLKSGETGYYFECGFNDSDDIQVFFITKKNNLLCSYRCDIPNEDAYEASIDEVKAILNTLKIEK